METDTKKSLNINSKTNLSYGQQKQNVNEMNEEQKLPRTKIILSRAQAMAEKSVYVIKFGITQNEILYITL